MCNSFLVTCFQHLQRQSFQIGQKLKTSVVENKELICLVKKELHIRCLLIIFLFSSKLATRKTVLARADLCYHSSHNEG